MAVNSSEVIVDYIIFFVFIVASTIWPLWTRKKTPQTKASYVFAAGGRISVGAMLMSLARGTLGVRTFLGSPSELFYRGSAMWEIVYGMALAFPIVSILFVPVYYPLGITSVYQYLDLRFKSRAVRSLASLTYILRQLLILGTAIFTPCVALNTIIGLPYWISILGLTCISLLFTIFGGLKAAIKADVVQGLTMILISFVIIIQCCVEVGGIAPIVKIPYENGRLKFFQSNGDMTVRIDSVSAIIGQLFMSMSLYGCQQNFVQRYCSMESQKVVKKTLMLVIPLLVSLFSLSWICGMGIFATYVDCDPLTSGQIRKMDEILPFFIMDKFTYFPGFMGLFLGSLFNGALSISVSNINSVATVIYEDFVSRLPPFSNMKDVQQVTTIKVIGVLCGIIIMGISFSISFLSGVMESGILVTSATSGPLLGVFILAMFIPCATWKGAMAGMVTSHLSVMWVTISHFIYDKREIEMLPLSTEGCTNETFTASLSDFHGQWFVPQLPLEVNQNTTYFLQFFNSFNNTVDATPVETESTNPLMPLYMMTYMYYAVFGTLITIIVGIIVSLVCKSDESDKYERKLLHPAVLRLGDRFPWLLQKYIKTENVICANGVNYNHSAKVNSNDCKELDNPAFEMSDYSEKEKQSSIIIELSDGKN